MVFCRIFILPTLMFCFFLSNLFAERVYFVRDPSGRNLRDPLWFVDGEIEYPTNWQMLNEKLIKKGIQLELSDLSEFSDPDTNNDILRDTKKIIFFDIPVWISGWEQKIMQLPKEKLLLIMYEPPTIRPRQYIPQVQDLFGKVLTWHDPLVDNVKFFKFYCPVYLPMTLDVPDFSDRKLVTQISRCKKGDHPQELYSERVKVINYFEKTKGNDFDFYGTNWDPKKYKRYAGRIWDKRLVLKGYRFSFCYENMYGMVGYVSEKIFDCFASGCVPIYWGAPNIETYVPKNCFIAKENFSTLAELHSFIKNMPESEYNRYLENIREYLKTDKAKLFSKEVFTDILMERIEK